MSNNDFLYVVIMIALVLQLTAITTDYWGSKSAKKDILPGKTHGEASMGLWRVCGEIWGKYDNEKYDLDFCVHLPPEGEKSFPKNSLYTVRIFALMAVVFLLFALLCLLTMKEKHTCYIIFFFLAGISSLIANIVWATELLSIKVSDSKEKLKFNPGFSFYLNLCASIVCLFGGAMSFIKF